MFVGCVVAGAVVLASGGAKARGALLRDVAAYLTAVGATAGVLASGRATAGRAAALLALYAAFVAVVLGADLWRIARERMRWGFIPCSFTRIGGVPCSGKLRRWWCCLPQALLLCCTQTGGAWAPAARHVHFSWCMRAALWKEERSGVGSIRFRSCWCSLLACTLCCALR